MPWNIYKLDIRDPTLKLKQGSYEQFPVSLKKRRDQQL